MKLYHALIALVITTALFGCTTIEPVQTGMSGEYIHSPSEVVFPRTLGAFQRGNYHIYDPKGKNLSVAYNFVTPTEQIAVTIYAYPAPKLISIGSPKEVVIGARTTLFKQNAEADISTIIYSHQKGQLLEKKEIQNQIGTPEIEGVFARFSYEESFAHQKQEVLSELHLFQKDKWLIKYRITYPEGIQDNARTLIDALMSDHGVCQP